MDTFGERVGRYRERLGMNQKTLAERGGLSPAHLNRIEKGTRKPPGVTTVLRLARTLRLTRAEAAELLALAGYSPLVLTDDGGLAYSSPSPPEQGEGVVADLAALYAALAALPPAHQQACVDALVALLTHAGASAAPVTREDGDADDA